uniref:Uncharacterized protein n=1 Tax=viral metagenome TaxID=1070528 RepID=A0A6C0B6J3_9ZZZZ
MARVQFSYPLMSGTLTNGKVSISDDGGGYFQCNYNTGSGDIYKLFKPTEMLFLPKALIITHKYNNDTLYVQYKTTQDSKRYIITNKNVYINKLIGDGIETTKSVNFTGKTCDLSNNGTNYYINMETIGPIPVNIVESKNAINPISTISPWTKVITIPLSSSSFITDEIVCDSGINMDTKAKEDTYKAMVSSNLGISMGAGLLIIFMVATGFANYPPIFSDTDTWIKNWNGFRNSFYNGFFLIMFLLSIACFISYGVLMNFDGPRDLNTISGLLSASVISLIIFVFMVGYKVLYLIPSAPAPAPAPAAV